MAETRKTRVADIHLHEKGFVSVKIRAGAVQTLEDAIENIHVCGEISGGVRRPICVDLSEAEPANSEVRHYYSGKNLIDRFTAMAVVVHASPFGISMGNIYLKVARPEFPSRIFTDMGKAQEWLMKQLEKKK